MTQIASCFLEVLGSPKTKSMVMHSHFHSGISKGVIRFGKKGKLNPRFIGPFKILEIIGSIAYKISLTPLLCHMHDIFHISILRKYLPNPSHVIEHEPIVIEKDLSYKEELTRIIDKKEKILRNRIITLVKVIWKHHSTDEKT
ncbi:unnamed protein product [Musa textilis]